MKKIFIALGLAPVLAFIMIGIHVLCIMYSSYQGPDADFSIRDGQGFASINHELYQQGLIKNPRIFHYYARFKKVMSHFKAGKFIIPHGSNMLEVLNILVYGNPGYISITVPEGKNIYEIAQILDKNGVTPQKDFLAKATDLSFIKNLKLPMTESEMSSYTSVEGYLYPETYLFLPNTSAEKVITSMVKEFLKKVGAIDFTHSQLSKHQIIILASLVEKETGARAEKKTIAGVFTNRLKKKMRLQSDPTTIYGMWEKFVSSNGNVTRKDLHNKTPFNTYEIDGLPIGPVCNPDVASIKAVLAPEKNDFLFFVSRNDGTHYFSKTYGEHQQQVNFYQLDPKQREGKSWRDLQQTDKESP